ncbi:MAG: tetratricopeptide repeat protein [Planctomycetia bacterium]|nr:tetratricopeptide repeat protein [Planctomycetia bacterium]
MFRSAFLASALLGSGLGPVCFAAPIELPSSDDGAATHPAEIRAAIEMFEQGDVNGAFERLKTSAADYPHLPPPRIMLANLYFSSDNYAAGRLSLEQAAVEHPEDPETLLILGDLLIRERRWTEADALYGRGEALWKEFKGNKDRRQELEGRLCAGLAAVAEARTQWELATTRLKRWIEVAPKKMAAHQRLGRAYFMLKREKEAFAEFQLATANATGGPPAPIMMAMLFLQQDQLAKGEEWIKYALDKAPQDFRTQLGAAQWNWEAGQLEAAAKHAAEAIKLNGDSLDARLLSAQAAFYQGQLSDAEVQLEALRESMPGNILVVNLLAWTLASSDDAAKVQRSVELAAINSQRFPESADAAVTLAWALFRDGKEAESHASLKRVKANAQLSRDAAYYAARILEAAGETEQAKTLLRGALENVGPFASESEARAWSATLTPATSPGS